jgi:thioesterase domain-containing protein
MTMPTDELQAYLHAHIPLSHAMQVSVLEITADNVLLAAPLAPNINHRETVFGGSASALAILSAWALLHTRLRSAGVESRLVIQRNTMDYELPILGDFRARSSLADADAWPQFMRMLSRRGKGRMEVHAVLECAGQAVGRLSGEFVALC